MHLQQVLMLNIESALFLYYHNQQFKLHALKNKFRSKHGGDNMLRF